MNVLAFLKSQFHFQRRFAVQFTAILVGLHGVFILATGLLDQIATKHDTRLTDIVIDIPLLVGVSLVYLSNLLRRRKRTAWQTTVVVYGFYFGLTFSNLVTMSHSSLVTPLHIMRAIVLPITILLLLLMTQDEFIVRSDAQGFRWAVRLSVGLLLLVFIYGTAGYSLMDDSDFHQQVSVPSAMSYTIDRFNFTANDPLKPYTRRARVFEDSLAFVSFFATVYAVVALFQPLRARFGDQSVNRRRLLELLDRYDSHSEDYFKLWPHDKQYFFDYRLEAGLAYRVHRGVAVVLGDPVGRASQFSRLFTEFGDFCFGNDWTPTFVHVEETYRELYEANGFALQKLGQEAVIDIEKFLAETARTKNFRHIQNKFSKQGFAVEVVQPPHSAEIMARLTEISNEWLEGGGRAERGFAMGYFTPEYMQDCPLALLKDADGTIVAFLNQLPATFDTQEATYDLLRQTKTALPNANDYLLIRFMDYLHNEGYQRLNLGLCPLVGLEESPTETNALVDGLLRFTYANGDRFYSFSGLRRFKSKYEPEWRDRFIVYRGGVRGFSRAISALMRAMKV